MKKQLTTIAAFTLIAASVSAQQAAKINGQPFNQGDWFGSNNNEAVIFKANNNQGIKIKPNGEVVFKSLDINSTTTNGLALTDGQGKLFRLNFPNDATKVLLGNGTFGNFSTAGQWLTSGSSLYWNTGNVSIGSTPNSFKLNVEGDARVSNDLFVNHDLFVGGGVIISDKIQGVTEIKGWDFKVENDIQVTGSARFNGTTQLDQGLSFDGTNGIKHFTNPDGSSSIKYGNINTPFGTQQICAAQPYAYVNHQFGGWMQIFNADAAGNYVPNSGLLNFQTWTGGSSIDASLGGNTGSAKLLLNYFCGNDVAICTGTNGGRVSIGNELEARRNVRIGYYGLDPFDSNTSLLISQSTPNSNALKFYTWEPTVKLISIESPGLSYSTFNLFGDGHVVISTANDDALTIKSANGQSTNFKVKNSGTVYARAINVTLNTFPDYVFADGYKLMPLNELETYITQNKHLPSFPSEQEVITNGADLGELQKLNIEKTEELTLYILQLKKELELLKEELKATQDKIK